MRLRSHTFRGKRWRIRWRRMKGWAGLADGPTEPAKEILIDPRQEGLDLLETLIHEGLHCCAWDWGEEAVHDTAADIARLVWRAGFRQG